MRLAWMLMLLFSAWPASSSAQARVFSAIAYSVSGDPADPRRIDLHTPGTPGPHPMIAIVGFEGAEGLARSLAQQGHVVAVVAVDAGTLAADLDAATVWLWRRGTAYTGDPNRLHFLLTGAAAAAALTRASDPRPLREAGVSTHAVRGIAIVGQVEPENIVAVPASGTLPPLLLIADAEPRRRAPALAAVTLAERWRAAGGAAEVVRTAAGPALLESIDTILLSWLPTVAINRVSRFESMRFAADPGPPADAGRLTALVAESEALLAVTAGSHVVVWRRNAADGPWRQDLDAGSGRVLWIGKLTWPVGGEQAVLLAAVDGRLKLWRRPVGASAWHAEADLRPVDASVRAAWVIALPPTPTASGVVLVGLDAGSQSAILRLVDDGSRVAFEGVPGGLQITGMAVLRDSAYAAVFDAGGGRILRRSGGPAGVWTTAAAWNAARGPIAGLHPLVPEVPALVGMLGNGELVRIDPARGQVVVETDLVGALGANWGGLGSAGVGLSDAGFVELVHPHTGDRVLAAGLRVSHPRAQRGGGWYLLRQAGGRYAYGRAADAVAGGGPDVMLRGLVASPFVRDAGGAVYALSAAEDAPLLRGTLSAPRHAQGFWADRARDDRGLVLRRSGDGWLALLYLRDAAGQPRWYSASGSIEDRRWQSPQGLLRYRRDVQGGSQRAETVGTFDLRFGLDAADPACAGRGRSDAVALAEMRIEVEGMSISDCIEPLRASGSIRAATDGSGIWTTADGGWGIAVQSGSAADANPERALLFHFGADGQPRWALGRGEQRDGRASLVVSEPGTGGIPTGTLGYRFTGPCSRIEGSASVDVALEVAGVKLRRTDAPLLRVDGAACY
jgi:hypothetical protein